MHPRHFHFFESLDKTSLNSRLRQPAGISVCDGRTLNVDWMSFLYTIQYRLLHGPHSSRSCKADRSQNPTRTLPWGTQFSGRTIIFCAFPLSISNIHMTDRIKFVLRVMATAQTNAVVSASQGGTAIGASTVRPSPGICNNARCPTMRISDHWRARF